MLRLLVLLVGLPVSATGDLVVERHLRQGKLWGACPRIVARDGPGLTALSTPAGTVEKRPGPLDGGPLQILGADKDWRLVDWSWSGEGILLLALPDAAHAVYCFWRAGEPRTLSCWYVNLEKPMRRTALGFDTLDQILDVLVSPDRSSWQWKDEDELQELLDRASISPEQAAALRSEGEHAIALLQAADSPYSRD